MPGRRHHRDAQARGVDHLAVGQRTAQAAQKAAATSPHNSAGEVDDLIDAPGVVLVPVADQDQRNGAQLGDFGDVLLVVGAGIDDDDLVAARSAQHPGVRTLECHEAGVVAQQHRGRRGHRAQQPVGRVLDRHFTSTMTSTSTGASSGNSATPTAERACAPASPNTSAKSSDAPLITPGWPVNPGADATYPPTLTTRVIESIPTRASTAANAFRAHTRASVLPTSGVTSPPTLPVTVKSPDTN